MGLFILTPKNDTAKRWKIQGNWEKWHEEEMKTFVDGNILCTSSSTTWFGLDWYDYDLGSRRIAELKSRFGEPTLLGFIWLESA